MLIILFLAISMNIPNLNCHEDARYEDDKSLNKSCYPFNSCKSDKAIMCRCDEQCAVYGDCCADSLYCNIGKRDNAFICRKQQEYSSSGVYAKGACPRTYMANSVRQKCEGISPFNDIELQVPVFSSRSSITYRNYYCALCNNDQNDLIFWDVALLCDRPVDEREIMENLVYNNEVGTWGFWDVPNGKSIWVSCRIAPQLSDRISHYRECLNTMISECHPRWRNNRVRYLCNLYESRMSSRTGNIYKNFHCALCNNVSVENLQCLMDKPDVYFPQQPHGYGGYSGSARGILTINFGDLIDINLKKGNRIEKLNKCPNGQLYDEAFDRCAEVFCIGNRVPRGGKCVVA